MKEKLHTKNWQEVKIRKSKIFGMKSVLIDIEDLRKDFNNVFEDLLPKRSNKISCSSHNEECKCEEYECEEAMR